MGEAGTMGLLLLMNNAAVHTMHTHNDIETKLFCAISRTMNRNHPFSLAIQPEPINQQIWLLHIVRALDSYVLSIFKVGPRGAVWRFSVSSGHPLSQFKFKQQLSSPSIIIISVWMPAWYNCMAWKWRGKELLHFSYYYGEEEESNTRHHFKWNIVSNLPGTKIRCDIVLDITSSSIREGISINLCKSIH